MNFEQGFNKIEKNEKYNPNIRVGDFSDIESTVNFCAFSKAVENKWGNYKDILYKEVE